MKIANSSDEEAGYSAPVHLHRSLPRLFISVIFIVLASLWLLYSGVKTSLSAYSDPTFNIKSEETRVINRTRNMASSAAARAPFILKESGKATGLVIFLHGLGDQGHGWSQAFEGFKQKHIRYVFPNAAPMPVTLNMGMVMPSWFDITSLNMKGDEDESGIIAAADNLRALMKQEQEKTGVPTNRVILGGFSMGGALALYTGLTHPEPIGGLVLLSTWLPLRNNFAQNKDGMSLTKQCCPIFQGHGLADPMVNVQYGNSTHEIIKKARGDSIKTVFKTYKNVGHSSCEQELEDVRDFIQEFLPPV